jgi:hypothetical protein
MRPTTEGGGPLGDEQLNGAVGTPLGGGWRPEGGRAMTGGEAWSIGRVERPEIYWASVDATNRSGHDRRGRELAMN